MSDLLTETCAIIIPIYPKHYHYIYVLLMQKIYEIIDIYLVFSSEADYQLFLHKNRIRKIIIPENNTNENGNIVTYKKFYALEQLANNINYDYFIVCDAEIGIVNKNFTMENIITKIKNIYENKTIYAGENNNSFHNNITRTSTQLFNEQSDVNKLQYITNNYKLYYWWSDIPVYKRDHLTHFFSTIHYNYDILNFSHFDHLIYLNYLHLYHEFRFLNLKPIINIEYSLEEAMLNREQLNKLEGENYGFGFVNAKTFFSKQMYYTDKGTLLLFHLDR